MRKLTQAEIKFLSAIPHDHVISEQMTIRGTLRPYEFPKGTNRKTIENLWQLGLLKLGHVWASELPCSLTDKGKSELKTATESQQKP